jgi:hypothetical protein
VNRRETSRDRSVPPSAPDMPSTLHVSFAQAKLLCSRDWKSKRLSHFTSLLCLAAFAKIEIQISILATQLL